MNPIKKHPFAGLAVATVLVLSTAGVGRANAQCSDPGLKHAGTLYVAGSFNSNGNARPEILLPRGEVRLDQTFHQTAVRKEGGGSDSHSQLQVSQIPPGICIVASGTEFAIEKGWAVHSPALRVTDDDGERVLQRGFSMTLYCTVGSGIQDMGVGGCNAKVDVFYKPLATVAAVPQRKLHSTR
jgi:hypothetical protein